MERMRNMARYYRLSKPVSDEESAEILKEMRDLEDIKMAEITEDRAYLEVETLDDIYSGESMSAAVNICSRIAHGCEISFAKFGIQ